VHLSNTFSAIFTAARLGAELLGDQVTLVDSAQVSMGLGWQVLAGAEVASAGGSQAEALAAIRSVRQRVSVLAALDTIEYLRRGGRASLLTAMLGEMLHIKPLLEVKAVRVITLARLRTRQEVREGLVARLEALGPLERLAVLHTDCLVDAQALAGQLDARAKQPPRVVEAAAAICTHVERGAIGVAAAAAARAD
jgi:DegV family protein with EDD domain